MFNGIEVVYVPDGFHLFTETVKLEFSHAKLQTIDLL